MLGSSYRPLTKWPRAVFGPPGTLHSSLLRLWDDTGKCIALCVLSVVCHSCPNPHAVGTHSVPTAPASGGHYLVIMLLQCIISSHLIKLVPYLQCTDVDTEALDGKLGDPLALTARSDGVGVGVQAV